MLEPLRAVLDAGLATATGWTVWVTVPLCSTWRETLARFETWPRGTPNPAELFRISTLVPGLPTRPGGKRLTVTIVVPLVVPPTGGCGGLNPVGAFKIVG